MNTIRAEVIAECAALAERCAAEDSSSAKSMLEHHQDDQAEMHREWAEGAAHVATLLRNLK